MKKALGLMLALLLMVTGVAQASVSRIALDVAPTVAQGGDVKPFEDCEMSAGIGVSPSNTWAWSYATQQFGLQVETMTLGDSTYRFLQTHGGSAAANAVYTHRGQVAYRVYQAANQGPYSSTPGGDAVYRALHNDAGVSGQVASNAKVAASQRIQQIFYQMFGGCGGGDY